MEPTYRTVEHMLPFGPFIVVVSGSCEPVQDSSSLYIKRWGCRRGVLLETPSRKAWDVTYHLRGDPPSRARSGEFNMTAADDVQFAARECISLALWVALAWVFFGQPGVSSVRARFLCCLLCRCAHPAQNVADPHPLRELQDSRWRSSTRRAMWASESRASGARA